MDKEKITIRPDLTVRMPDPGIYAVLGSEGIRSLVQEVYEVLALSAISSMFPQDSEALKAAADKSALFWIGICGGPPLYEEQIGPPRMKMRHQKFHINKEGRDVWVSCWMQILNKEIYRTALPEDYLNSLKYYIEDFSLWMINE